MGEVNVPRGGMSRVGASDLLSLDTLARGETVGLSELPRTPRSLCAQADGKWNPSARCRSSPV